MSIKLFFGWIELLKKNDKYASGAMYFMADIYYYEVFGRQDKDKAFYWLEKSAQLGHPMTKEKLVEWKNWLDNLQPSNRFIAHKAVIFRPKSC